MGSVLTLLEQFIAKHGKGRMEVCPVCKVLNWKFEKVEGGL